MMKKCISFTSFAATLVLLALMVPQALAVEYYLDRRLALSGYFHLTTYTRTHIPRDEGMFHDTNLDFARISTLFEAMYKLKKSEDLNINIMGGLRYHYMLDAAIDEQMKRGIPRRAYKDYKTLNDDEIITELYVDFIKDPWQVRMGKQIVIWGETDIQRTADVVNPLDVRFGAPGVDDWENIKRGLWMIRSFYQSELPGNLLFEFIFVPGDYQNMMLPYEGTHFGPNPAETSMNPGKGFGMTHWLFEKMRRDAPGWNLGKNWEFGFRLRGYTWDIDWTVQYYNSRVDVPLIYPNRATEFALQYVQAGIRSLVTGGSINPGDWPDYKVFRYPRYQIIGGSMQTMIQKLHHSAWRFEWSLDFGNYYNKGTDASSDAIYDLVKRNTFSSGLNYSDKFRLPYLATKFFNETKTSTSLTLFYEKVFNHDHDLILGESHLKHKSTATSVSWSIMQFFWHHKGMFMFLGNYNPINRYMMVTTFAYIPDDHWRFEIAHTDFGDRSHNNLASKDSILLRVRYEW